MLKYVNYDIVFQEFPGEVTLAVNLSLCPNGCPGCHSDYLQQDVGEELTTERLFSLLAGYDGEVTCVGLMGGDNDAAAVMALCDEVKRKYGDQLKTGWYSGRQQLPHDFRPEVFDYVKLGPYRADFGPLKSPTTNQRLYRVRHDETDEGREADKRKDLEDITDAFWRRVEDL